MFDSEKGWALTDIDIEVEIDCPTIDSPTAKPLVNLPFEIARKKIRSLRRSLREDANRSERMSNMNVSGTFFPLKLSDSQQSNRSELTSTPSPNQSPLSPSSPSSPSAMFRSTANKISTLEQLKALKEQRDKARQEFIETDKKYRESLDMFSTELTKITN